MKKIWDLGGNLNTDFTGEVDLETVNEQKSQSKTLHVEKTSKKGCEK